MVQHYPSWVTDRYIVFIDLPNGLRLFCQDVYRREWTENFLDAERFRALSDAAALARRVNGRAERWADAYPFEARDETTSLLAATSA